jgi:hypothetical protein
LALPIIAALALQAAALASPGPFTITFAPDSRARTLSPEGLRVTRDVAAALHARPDAVVIIESRGWGGMDNYSPAACRWPRVARRELLALGIHADRIALRAPNHMQWERAPSDTAQSLRPQLDFRLTDATALANVRVMPDSC